MDKEDLTGKQFGFLTVLRIANEKVRGCIAWECQCSCGNKCLATTFALKSGHKKSCGHLRTTTNYHIGEKFGRLLIIDKAPDKNGRHEIVCQCDCGNIKNVNLGAVLSGKIISCGCYQTESIKERFTNNLVGQRFGRLVVIEQDDNIGGRVTWRCKCDCGNYVTVKSCCLTGGFTNSCGCLKSELSSERFSHKLEGQKFGKLTVIKRNGTLVGSDGTQYSQWLCKCECGTEITVRGHDLVSGGVKSCGCLVSAGEYEMRLLLNKYNIKFKTQQTFDDLVSDAGGKLKFDFSLLDEDNNILALIEYQGIQHYKEQPMGFGEQQRLVTDKQKKDYCHNKNIRLYEIRYDEETEPKLKEILLEVYK